MKYNIFSLDIWGNEEDGWERNDYFSQGTIEILEGENPIKRLIDENYLVEDAEKFVQYEDFSNGYIDILLNENGKPILELQELQ